MTALMRIVVAAASFMVCARAQAEAPAQEGAATERSWTMQLSAEAGVGLRNIDLPRDGVVYQVRTGAYPALGTGFRLDYHGSPSFRLGLVARYQSSIGLSLQEQLTDGTQHARKTRSHHVDVAIGPEWQASESGWGFGAALGYQLWELDPRRDLGLPQ